MMLTQPAITCSKLTVEALEQRCEICSKLKIKPPKRRHRFGGFIVNFEHFSHLCFSVSIVNFEQVNAGWEVNEWFYAIVSAMYVMHAQIIFLLIKNFTSILLSNLILMRKGNPFQFNFRRFSFVVIGNFSAEGFTYILP